MNWRKNTVLIVGGLSALVLLILSTMFLLGAQKRYSEVEQRFESASRRLEQLIRRTPFPSAENIARTTQNLAEVRSAALQLEGLLQEGQMPTEALEPAGFSPLLERTLRALQSRADESGVTLPEHLGLGFARYAAGQLPARDTVPRLVVQLRAIAALCGILFDSRIAWIEAIERDAFDSPRAAEPAAAEGRRARRAPVAEVATGAAMPPLPLVASNALYDVERLVVVFRAREAAAWEAINAIARAPQFFVITDVRLENTGAATIGKRTPVTPVSPGDAALGVPPQFPAHEDRIVAGRELVRVGLTLDLYRFRGVFSEEASP